MLVGYVLTFSITFQVRSQVLHNDRAVNWSIAGLRDTSTANFVYFNALNEGFSNDGITPNDDVLQVFLSNHPESLMLHFPAGNYLFHQPIVMRSNLIIRGAGATETVFKLNLNGSGHGIRFVGTSDNTELLVINDGNKGLDTIAVADASSINPNDWVHLSQEDADLVTSSWAIGTVGQIMRVREVDNNTLILDSELRTAYELSRSPRIRKIVPVYNSGIECIHIARQDNTAPEQASTIFMQRAVNCWVSGVESDATTYAHVELRYCSNIAVTHSYFHHAFEYGGGGRAYGAMLHFSTNECLIYHNTFEHLRHSMILQAGANGNVFAYNRSFDPYWEQGIFFPSNSAGDMVLHGNYPFANLFEQNDGQNIVIDNSHGANGPFNTFLRNRASLYGIFFSDNSSPVQNFIGNEIPNNNAPYSLVNYNILGSNHFIYGNNNKGMIDPSGTEILSDSSYFFTSGIPNFIPNEYYASIGVPNALNSGTITATIYAAEENFFAGSCNYNASLEIPMLEGDDIIVYPNPAESFLATFGSTVFPGYYEIIDQTGNVVQNGDMYDEHDHIRLDQIESGNYLFRFNGHVVRFVKL